MSDFLMKAKLRGEKSINPNVIFRNTGAEVFAEPAGLIFRVNHPASRGPLIITWSGMEEWGWYYDIGFIKSSIVLWIRYEDVETDIVSTLEFEPSIPLFTFKWEIEQVANTLLRKILAQRAQHQEGIKKAVKIHNNKRPQ